MKNTSVNWTTTRDRRRCCCQYWCKRKILMRTTYQNIMTHTWCCSLGMDLLWRTSIFQIGHKGAVVHTGGVWYGCHQEGSENAFRVSKHQIMSNDMLKYHFIARCKFCKLCIDTVSDVYNVIFWKTVTRSIYCCLLDLKRRECKKKTVGFPHEFETSERI